MRDKITLQDVEKVTGIDIITLRAIARSRLCPFLIALKRPNATKWTYMVEKVAWDKYISGECPIDFAQLIGRIKSQDFSEDCYIDESITDDKQIKDIDALYAEIKKRMEADQEREKALKRAEVMGKFKNFLNE